VTTHRKPLFDLTAGDLMCRNLVTVREGMPLRDAAHLLIRASVHGVPVVDAAGRCVGVLSMTDLDAIPFTLDASCSDLILCV